MKIRWMRLGLWAVLLLCCAGAFAQEVKHVPDVIYGRKHGVALTMDVFRPAKPNGIGVIWIVSGGWFSSHDAVAPGVAKPFTDKGQTVFEVVHGSQPKYTIPEITQDLHRAVRYIRVHAAEYGVDPDRLGICGGSAGGHLSLMIGASGGPGAADAPDPVDRASSAVQAVAALFPPTDFLNWGKEGENVLMRMATGLLSPFAAAFPVTAETSKQDRARIAREVSPITYVTAKMPPTLLIHGDADELVPLQQSERLAARLTALKVPSRLIVRKGQGHGWATLGAEDLPVMADWFAQRLPARP